jgi:uncharacterized membrane-anchored protein
MDHRELARMGGKARANKLSPERRTEIAKNAVEARESKKMNEDTYFALMEVIKFASLHVQKDDPLFIDLDRVKNWALEYKKHALDGI